MNLSENNPISCLKQIITASTYLIDGSRVQDYFSDRSLYYDAENAMKLRRKLLSLCTSVTSTAVSNCFQKLANRHRTSSVSQISIACANATSNADTDYILSCIESLLHPRHYNRWSMNNVVEVCSSVKSAEQAKAVDTCMYELQSTQRTAILSAQSNISGSNVEDIIVEMCKHENASQSSLHCVREALKPPRNDFDTIALGTIVKTCSSHKNHHGNQTGSCLNKLLFSSRYHSLRHSFLPIHYDSTPIADSWNDLCTGMHYDFHLKCLDSLNTIVIFENDLLSCMENYPVGTILQLKLYWSESDDQPSRIVTGSRFHLLFEVKDQWNDRFLGSSTFRIALSRKSQAQLWGILTNTSSNGWLNFDFLAISNPGQVEIIVVNSMNAVVAAMSIVVQGQETNDKCIRLLSVLQCSAYDYYNDLPVLRHVLPSSFFFSGMICVDYLQSWHVYFHQIPLSTEYIVLHRQGIDAILLRGSDFPQEMSSHEDRLQLRQSQAFQTCKTNACGKSTQKRAIKDIRHNYYKMSLLWHPDRWVGLERYQLVAQGAFELISQSYEAVLDMMTKHNAVTTSL